MFELMWDCFPQWCFDLRRRREASRFSGIVVSKGWWTDPNLGNLVHNACGKVCLNELSLDSYLVVHIYLWEANLKGTWGPWLPAVWGILGTSPLTPQFTQAPETSHPYRSRKAGAKSGWRCLHWMCLRNCFSSNPVAGTISNNAVFTLICSQDHLLPWAFRFHWERTSGTKMRKLMSWDRDSLIGEGKRKKNKWDYSPWLTGRPVEQRSPWKPKLHCSLPLPIFIPEHINHYTVWNIPLASLAQLWLPAPLESWVWLHQVPAGSKHCSSGNGDRISVLTLHVQKRQTKQLMVKLPTPGHG